MTDDYDDNVVYGDEIGYVPCFQAASAVPTLVADDNAVYGEESGYVPLDTAAAADPASEQDELAVYGDNVGFVAKPCEEVFDFEHAVGGILQNIGNSSYHKQIKRIVGTTNEIFGPPGDTITDFGTLVGQHVQEGYRHPFGSYTGARQGQEGRSFFAHDAPFYEFGGAGGLPFYNFARLRARLVPAAFFDLPSGAVAVDWVIGQGILGSIGANPDPDWDTSVGAPLASGTIAENEHGGPFTNFIDLDIWIPVTGGQAQWVVMFGGQPEVNGTIAHQTPADPLNEPGIFPRNPDIGSSPGFDPAVDDWGALDSYGLQRGTTGPTDTSSFVIDDYWLQWYEVPLL
jgi:hypothetical protein